jgi:hypothetical protein
MNKSPTRTARLSHNVAAKRSDVLLASPPPSFPPPGRKGPAGQAHMPRTAARGVLAGGGEAFSGVYLGCGALCCLGTSIGMD